MPTSFTMTIDRVDSIAATLRRLSKIRVLVGIPSDDEQPHHGDGGLTPHTEERDTGEIGNAALGYIHENGSPINNVPARPWLQPGVSESQRDWVPYFEQAARAAFEGDEGRLDRSLNAAGIKAVSAVKNRIVAKIPPPLAQSTIDARRRRLGPGAVLDITPLIDTSQMLNSISYVIRKGTRTRVP